MKLQKLGFGFGISTAGNSSSSTLGTISKGSSLGGGAGGIYSQIFDSISVEVTSVQVFMEPII